MALATALTHCCADRISRPGCGLHHPGSERELRTEPWGTGTVSVWEEEKEQAQEMHKEARGGRAARRRRFLEVPENSWRVQRVTAMCS